MTKGALPTSARRYAARAPYCGPAVSHDPSLRVAATWERWSKTGIGHWSYEPRHTLPSALVQHGCCELQLGSAFLGWRRNQDVVYQTHDQ